MSLMSHRWRYILLVSHATYEVLVSVVITSEHQDIFC
jgi:hypothetical protein